jgi:hypothetical protein
MLPPIQNKFGLLLDGIITPGSERDDQVVIFADNALLRPAYRADHLSSSPPQVGSEKAERTCRRRSVPYGRALFVKKSIAPLGRHQIRRIPYRHPGSEWSRVADLLAWIAEIRAWISDMKHPRTPTVSKQRWLSWRPCPRFWLSLLRSMPN